MVDLVLIISALVAAIVLKMAYTKAAGPTMAAAPELEDVGRQEISEVDASKFLAKVVDKKNKQTGDFVE